MIRDTDKDWAKVAEEHPYWGVLSDEKFRGADLTLEDKAQFYASGAKFINDLLAFVRRHISPSFQIDRGLDFGCGVGRLLIPIARQSVDAVGVDIAPQMLKLANANLAECGITNAVVVLGDDSLSEVTGTFNFVNSYIVLQHIPPERGILIIARLLRYLQIGGVFSLQMTYAKERRFFQHERDRAQFYRRTGTVIQDLLPVDNDLPEGTITMFDYDMNEIMLSVTRLSGHPLLVLPTDHDGHKGVHLVGVKARD
jgi:SAM-dependent methyltransferase